MGNKKIINIDKNILTITKKYDKISIIDGAEENSRLSIIINGYKDVVSFSLDKVDLVVLVDFLNKREV